MIASPHRLLDEARRDGWAIGAFNAANIETIIAIVQAAAALRAPVIIESSPGETAFIGLGALTRLVGEYRTEHEAQVLLNLDHATDPEVAEAAIREGFDLIHFDGGERPYEENVRLTREIAGLAHRHHRLVEGELDHITGSSTVHAESAQSVQAEGTYTDPQRAYEFVRATKIDTLAVFVGNVHGLYADAPRLDLDRLAEIRQSVSCFLSLHGGSGIRDADVQSAIKAGISKVNVNSELRLAYLQALQKAVKKPKEIAPYKFMSPVIEAVQKVVEEKIRVFGSAGQAKKTWVKRIIT